MRLGSIAGTACVAIVASGCAMAMGRPDPVERDVVIMRLDAAADAAQTAQVLTQQGAEYAIVSAPRDSAWFADVATRANLTTTRTGRVGGRSFGFVGPKALGDTTLTLNVPGGGVLRIHDALFEVDKNRHFDMMAVQFDSTVNVQRSVTRLLEYIAKDVGPTVSLLFMVEAETAALGDSVSVILRPLYTDMFECTAEGRAGTRAADLPIRVFYGPVARMGCESAERIAPGTLAGHFEIGR